MDSTLCFGLKAYSACGITVVCAHTNLEIVHFQYILDWWRLTNLINGSRVFRLEKIGCIFRKRCNSLKWFEESQKEKEKPKGETNYSQKVHCHSKSGKAFLPDASTWRREIK